MFRIANVLSHSYSDMSIFSPRRRPRITQKPKALDFIITNINDSMVVRQFRAAYVIKDTTCVKLKVAVNIQVDCMGALVSDRIGKGINSLVLSIDEVVS